MSSLFVITPMGIFRLMEPFRLVVRSNEMKEGCKEGQVVLASEVRYHAEYLIIFKVDGKWWSYRNFVILL